MAVQSNYVISIKEFKRKANNLLECVNVVKLEITVIKNITMTVKANHLTA